MELEIKLEEERDVENFIDYVEDYFQLTPSDEQKGLRDLHEDFKKKTYNPKIFSSGFILHVYLRAHKWSSLHHLFQA